jgi:hypothetical protein
MTWRYQQRLRGEVKAARARSRRGIAGRLVMEFR